MIKTYCIGGLGADERVFSNLNLNFEITTLKWIDPKRNESLKEYTKRLSAQIITNEKIDLIGVSFGGIVAIEMSQIININKLIIISSLKSPTEKPWFWKFVSRTIPFKYIPSKFLIPPLFVAKFMFSAENVNLLKEILDDTKPEFVKWALPNLLKWGNENEMKNLIQIHGTADKLIPLNSKTAIKIENGGHFMIVDKANEIAAILNDK